MKALIKDGVVVDRVDAEFPVHKSFTFVDCPEDVVIGYKYENGRFIPPENPTLDELKQNKLEAVKTAFLAASETAHCMSSVGFEIDANETANRNIEGLVLVMQAGGTTLFRAYDNSFHEVTREQLEIMRKEIVINSQYLYQAKWTFEAQIMQAQTEETLADIDITAEALAELADSLKVAASEGAEDAETV